ncbi:MAG: hypothetical protein U5K29_10940 [Acidimicrobiales bacterium]|nr:hypothetical protein [Acidimicrobiales bacterium]
MRVAGAGSTFVGLVQAAGEIHLNGADHRFVCGMVGDSIRVAGSGNVIEGADCAAPDRTAVAPTVVPELSVDYAQAPGEVTPGGVVDATVTVGNDGARLVAPAIAGVENLGDDSLGVTGGDVVLEYLPAGATGWMSLGVPAAVSARPLPAAGVGEPVGSDPFAGVSVDPGSTALWAVEVTATIDPDTMAQLVDPDQVAGVRVVTDLDLDPVGAPVRRLVRFGPDLVDDIRADAGVITDAEALVVLPDGQAVRVTPAEVAGLAELGSGATATEAFEVAVPVPAGPGETESAQAYVARLAALDDTSLTGGAFAIGTGGPGRVLAPMASDSSTRRVPVVEAGVDGPGVATAGDELSFEVGLVNQGSAPADALDVTATVGGEPVEVTDLGDTLAAGGIDTATMAVTVPADADTGVLDLEVTIGWEGANSTAYGPVTVDHPVEVTAAGALSGSMGWFLHTDNTGNGLASPGDVIGYEATIVNGGDSPATEVAVELPVDPASVLVSGSATATDGVVTEIDGDTVTVADATVAPDDSLVVTALVQIPTGIDDTVRFLDAQATVTAAGLGSVVTDDPARFGVDQPTRTHLVRLVPVLHVTAFEHLAVDADGNGVASSGDTVGYVAEVLNGGTGAATDVVVTFDADPDTTIVDASATTGVVTVADGQVSVEVGEVGDDEPVEVRVAAEIAADLVAGTELVAEWAVDATGVADTPILESVVTELGAAVDPGEGGEGTGGGVDGLPTGGTAEIVGLVPADGGVVTEPTDVSVGTITPADGESITEWILTTYPAGVDPGDATVLAEGTGDPSDSVLAVFDPTTRANGIWTVRLEVVDSAGERSFAESGLVIDGQLKLGRYAVTYEDLSVPVAGIPIQVLRTYDTLNRDTEGDFGYGWNLELANFRVQTNRTLGPRLVDRRIVWRGSGVRPVVFHTRFAAVCDRDLARWAHRDLRSGSDGQHVLSHHHGARVHGPVGGDLDVVAGTGGHVGGSWHRRAHAHRRVRRRAGL